MSILNLSRSELETIYPAYLETDRRGVILSCGPSLLRHLEGDPVGASFLDEFEVLRPYNATGLKALLGDKVVCHVKHRTHDTLALRGIVVKRKKRLIFLLGHAPAAVTGETSLDYQFSDFSPSDGTPDILVSANIRNGLLKDSEELAERLHAEKIAAEMANVSKGNFLACMSHELRTPMNAVLGFSSLLAKTELSDDQAEMIHSIKTSGELLLQLLNDILDLTKVDAGKVEVEEEEFSLSNILSSLSSIYDYKAGEVGVDFSVEWPDIVDQHAFVGDGRRIKQVLNNFLSNAFKFTADGAVKVTVEASAKDMRRRPFAPSGEATMQVRFNVIDTGIGIGPTVMEKLFKPFTQADPTINRRFGGTGLGLSISKGLVEAMGGGVSVESEPGVGSTFSFTLPLRAREISVGFIEASAVSAAANARLNILVAEDNIVNQKVIGAMLGALKHQCRFAASGHEAIKLYTEGSYDLVLMDIQMPGMGGVEAMKRIRADAKDAGARAAPIVAFSAHAMHHEVKRFIEAGFDRHLSKPVNISDIEALIEDLFETKRAA